MTLVGLQQLGWECPSQELDALKLRLSKLGVNCLLHSSWTCCSPCFTECETMISCQVREKSGPALPGGWSVGRSNHCRDLWASLNRRAWGREEGPGMAILVVCEGRGNWMSGPERVAPGTQTQSCFQVPPWAFHESHHQEGLSPLHDTNSSEEGRTQDCQSLQLRIFSLQNVPGKYCLSITSLKIAKVDTTMWENAEQKHECLNNKYWKEVVHNNT